LCHEQLKKMAHHSRIPAAFCEKRLVVCPEQLKKMAHHSRIPAAFCETSFGVCAWCYWTHQKKNITSAVTTPLLVDENCKPTCGSEQNDFNTTSGTKRPPAIKKFTDSTP
jgi:hypothetical protein